MTQVLWAPEVSLTDKGPQGVPTAGGTVHQGGWQGPERHAGHSRKELPVNLSKRCLLGQGACFLTQTGPQSTLLSLLMKSKIFALAGVAQWIEHQPANPKLTGLSPSQDTCLG